MNHATLASENAHHLPTGAVSYALASEIFSEHESLIKRLKYLIDTVPDDDASQSHAFMGELINSAEESCEYFAIKAQIEKDKFGGNNVYVVKR